MYAMVWMTAALALFLMPSAEAGPAEDNPADVRGGIVWSSRCQGLLVGVPKGWLLNNRLAAAQGIDMLFYPEDARQSDGRIDLSLMVYVMPTVKERDGTPASTAGLIADALANFKAQDPTVQSRVEAPIAGAQDGVQWTTVQFDAARMPLFEEVTYLEDRDVIFAIVLAARSARQRQDNAGFTGSIARDAMILATTPSTPLCPALPVPGAPR